VVLKKPSELFNKKESTPFQEVREEYSGKDITTIDEALQSFQVNVNHIQSDCHIPLLSHTGHLKRMS